MSNKTVRGRERTVCNLTRKQQIPSTDFLKFLKFAIASVVTLLENYASVNKNILLIFEKIL